MTEIMENVVVGTKMPTKDADLLKQVCKARGENVSSFIRRAIRTELARLSYLSDADKKALGVHLTRQRSAEIEKELTDLSEAFNTIREEIMRLRK
jgi:metal-responsive CopG/Arc/MetJ family transcriptional regulator